MLKLLHLRYKILCIVSMYNQPVLHFMSKCFVSICLNIFTAMSCSATINLGSKLASFLAKLYFSGCCQQCKFPICLYGINTRHLELLLWRAGLKAQHTQDCPIFFIQLNNVHNHKEIRCCHLMRVPLSQGGTTLGIPPPLSQ